ncbi:related to cyclosome/APC subunit Cut20/Apc4 [Rhynchosporium secalis]|uniref:Anaphase-promoting complex subunit 4 n=1 Tax=Rhynchosporium secalis TaxID=38038 RepID=A0A1E1MQM4_RHYSE|nr:related to cyclosome/APC subunit Cut20/Apc4 [Rhynchosporium secalis]
MANLPGFQILSEKTLHHAADPRLITYCPSMDLLALVTTDQQVFIYRMNGQRVYGAIQKADKLGVESIRWKPNGQLLAIAWSDGSVRLVSTESSKIVLQFSAGDNVGGVTCMGWAMCLIHRSSPSSSKKRIESWGSFLAMDGGLSDEKVPLDLPQDLSLVDIEISLPKLSVLAAAGNSDDVFSSRSSLDALFRPFDPKDNSSVNVMVVGTKEGNIHLSIYDSFEIGSFVSPVIVDGSPCYLVRHASHQNVSTHALLMRPSKSDGSLYFVPMDLRFISASSEYISLLASRSTALNNLLRYIHQVQVLMVSEWKSTQDLPSRFLRNINETLAEKDSNRDIVQALYHSVATGHTFPAVREWLVDELSERGHKRWDKAVTAGLENLRRLVHENMLPALERCSIILSRFLGIVKFQGSNSSMGFTTQQINLIMDTVACLHLVSSKILIQVVDELELFSSFSAWIRHEIDRLASESSSTNVEAEKESSLDHSKVLLYLQTVMTSSPLATFFGEAPSVGEGEQSWNHSMHDLPMFELLDKELQKQERGLPYLQELPRVNSLCKFLEQQAHTIFGQIADAEKRNVLFGKPQSVGLVELDGPIDMRMSIIVSDQFFFKKHLTYLKNNHVSQTHIAFVPKGSSGVVHIVRAPFSIENGVSSRQGISSSAIQLGTGQIRDIKFLDDTCLLVLWELEGTARLLSIYYNSTDMEHSLNYAPHSGNASMSESLSNKEVLERFSQYRIPGDGSFVPGKIEIREQDVGQSHEDARRLCLLSKNMVHYKIAKFGATGELFYRQGLRLTFM